jgi:hypothetical protein
MWMLAGFYWSREQLWGALALGVFFIGVGLANIRRRSPAPKIVSVMVAVFGAAPGLWAGVKLVA